MGVYIYTTIIILVILKWYHSLYQLEFWQSSIYNNGQMCHLFLSFTPHYFYEWG